jgi:hypothetical protein
MSCSIQLSLGESGPFESGCMTRLRSRSIEWDCFDPEVVVSFDDSAKLLSTTYGAFHNMSRRNGIVPPSRPLPVPYFGPTAETQHQRCKALCQSHRNSTTSGLCCWRLRVSACMEQKRSEGGIVWSFPSIIHIPEN